MFIKLDNILLNLHYVKIIYKEEYKIIFHISTTHTEEEHFICNKERDKRWNEIMGVIKKAECFKQGYKKGHVDGYEKGFYDSLNSCIHVMG